MSHQDSGPYSWQGVMDFLQSQSNFPHADRIHWFRERQFYEERLQQAELQLKEVDFLNKTLEQRIRLLEQTLMQKEQQKAGHTRTVSDVQAQVPQRDLEVLSRMKGRLNVPSAEQLEAERRQRPVHRNSHSYGGQPGVAFMERFRKQQQIVNSPKQQEAPAKMWRQPDPMAMSEDFSVSRKLWHPQCTFRSHFDGVRGLVFCESSQVLVSGGEDCVMHLWDIRNTFEKEVNESAFTLRSHTILSMVGGPDGLVYSAGPEGYIRVTAIPPLSHLKRYEATEFNYCIGSWESHEDAVWSLAHHSTENWLLSASADGTVKLWKTLDKRCLLDLAEAGLSHSPAKTFIYAPQTTEGPATPTCVNWVQADANLLLVGYTSPIISMFNRETSQYALLDYKREKVIGTHQSNAIGSFPNSKLAVSGHEDRRLRFFDLNTCSQIKDLAGHTDAVSSVYVHSSGNYVVSGGHDGSLRFWDVRNFQCLHELPAHRRKYDEAVHCLAQHPSLPLFASAGADSLIKIYRCKL